MPASDLRRVVYASLMAALIAMGAYLHIPIPISPVPLVLQNLFVLLAGLLLGARWGLAAVGIYLFIGSLGMPVFVGGKGGVAHFVGPTGGYLLGFAACAWITGTLSARLGERTSGDVAAVVIGSMAIYLLGVPWLKAVTSMSWEKALMAGMVPFLPGDALKAAAAVILVRSLRPLMKLSQDPASA